MKQKLFLLSLIVLFTSASYGQMNRVKEVSDAAEKGYQAYLEKIPAGQESNYGFNDREEFARVKTGKPYQIIILKKKFFTDPELTGEDYLQPLDEWRVPLVVNHENRAFLTVARVDGQFKAVGLGAADLAREVGEFENEHPSQDHYGKILRVHKMTCDFLILPDEDNPASSVLFPLLSARSSLTEKGEPVKSYKLIQGLQRIKSHVQNN